MGRNIQRGIRTGNYAATEFSGRKFGMVGVTSSSNTLERFHETKLITCLDKVRHTFRTR
jgi:hypothetical protein